MVTFSNGIEPSTVEEVLLELGTAPGRMYLTGSRYFSNSVNAKSDCDVFCRDTEDIRSWLADHGFYLLSTSTYDNDPQLTAVYRHELGVDVQLTNDVAKKLKIQSLIKKYNLFIYSFYNNNALIDKPKQKEIWRAFYEALS